MAEDGSDWNGIISQQQEIANRISVKNTVVAAGAGRMVVLVCLTG